MYLGIDPGSASGGIALLQQNEEVVFAVKMPETEADISGIFELYSNAIKKALIEAVHSMPDQGVSSSFKFGMNYGFLRGLLIAHKIPFDQISPQRWQGIMNCMTHGDKNVSKAKAQQLFPRCPNRITHGNADALLIAETCRRLALGLAVMPRKKKEPEQKNIDYSETAENITQ